MTQVTTSQCLYGVASITGCVLANLLNIGVLEAVVVTYQKARQANKKENALSVVVLNGICLYT